MAAAGLSFSCEREDWQAKLTVFELFHKQAALSVHNRQSNKEEILIWQ
jgi:hypothetical protein